MWYPIGTKSNKHLHKNNHCLNRKSLASIFIHVHTSDLVILHKTFPWACGQWGGQSNMHNAYVKSW